MFQQEFIPNWGLFFSRLGLTMIYKSGKSLCKTHKFLEFKLPWPFEGNI